jgi:PII-like signaling protein
MTLLIVSSEPTIRAFLPEVEDLVREGLVMIDPVEVVKYSTRSDGA